MTMDSQTTQMNLSNMKGSLIFKVEKKKNRSIKNQNAFWFVRVEFDRKLQTYNQHYFQNK
jgi:hypothetical protein